MYGKLINYAMANLSHDALDKGSGIALLSASDKPRIILAMSCYAITNTTNAVPNVAMMPSIATPANAVYDLNSTPCCWILKSSQPLNGALATPYTPATLVPYIESRAGGGTFPILPPGYILIGAMGDVDGDGSVAWQVVSAECDY